MGSQSYQQPSGLQFRLTYAGVLLVAGQCRRISWNKRIRCMNLDACLRKLVTVVPTSTSYKRSTTSARVRTHTTGITMSEIEPMDSPKAILKEVVQHCLNKECDVMRNRVLDQIAKGLVALCWVTIGVVVESNGPQWLPRSAYTNIIIQKEDLEHLWKLLQITSLPLGNLEADMEFNRLIITLQDADAQGRSPRLTCVELSQVFEYLGSNLSHCLSPLALCFPELSLWAKQRALLVPGELAQKVTFCLISRQIH